MNYKVLLLNSTYEPLKVVTWQKAVVLYFGDKVTVVSEYPGVTLGSQHIRIPCPSVVALRTYVKVNREKISFSRPNLFARDSYTCQYCGDKPSNSALTFDHVIPRAHGGTTCWLNIVTACYKCNSKKRDRVPSDAGMYLTRPPAKPKSFGHLIQNFYSKNAPEEWLPYLPSS